MKSQFWISFRQHCESVMLTAEKPSGRNAQMNAIKVVDYNPAWPGLFEEQKRRILELIGDMVANIHHVGSTSIVGLCATLKIYIHAVLHRDALVADAIVRVKSVHDYTFHGDPMMTACGPSPKITAPTARGFICAVRTTPRM